MTMSCKIKKRNRAIVVALSLVLVISSFIYLAFMSEPIVKMIFPELIGGTWFALIVLFCVSKETKLKSFITFFSVVLLISILAYLRGISQNISYLINVMPEIIGATALAIGLSLILKKVVTI